MNALLAPRPQRVRTPLGFIVVATLIYLIDGAIAHSALFDTRPDLIAAAISVDLTVVVTFAYWWLVVRPGHAPLRSALPVFLVSVGTAALTLPAGHRDFVRYIRYLGAPFELAVVALVVIGVRRARRALAADGVEMDLPERIRLVLAQSLPYPRVADVMATEVTLLYYAVASWRRAPFVATGTKSFSYHRGNSYAAILYTLAVASVVEMVAAHLVLRLFAPRTAIALLVLSAFATFWLVGFARAVQLRPILLDDQTLRIRSGVRWSVDLAHGAVKQVSFGRVPAPAKGTAGYLRTTFGQPNVIIELKDPVQVAGAYGIQRTVDRLGLFIDDLASFKSSYDSARLRSDATR